MPDREHPAVRDAYLALERRDLPAFLAAFAHDVEYRIPDVLPWGGTRHGHDGIESFVEVMDEHVDVSVQPDEVIDAGDRIVVLGRFLGRALATGRTLEARFAHVWAFRNGVASQVEAYVDTAVVLDALRP